MMIDCCFGVFENCAYAMGCIWSRLRTKNKMWSRFGRIHLICEHGNGNQPISFDSLAAFVVFEFFFSLSCLCEIIFDSQDFFFCIRMRKIDSDIDRRCEIAHCTIDLWIRKSDTRIHGNRYANAFESPRIQFHIWFIFGHFPLNGLVIWIGIPFSENKTATTKKEREKRK